MSQWANRLNFIRTLGCLPNSSTSTCDDFLQLTHSESTNQSIWNSDECYTLIGNISRDWVVDWQGVPRGTSRLHFDDCACIWNVRRVNCLRVKHVLRINHSASPFIRNWPFTRISHHLSRERERIWLHATAGVREIKVILLTYGIYIHLNNCLILA